MIRLPKHSPGSWIRAGAAGLHFLVAAGTSAIVIGCGGGGEDDSGHGKVDAAACVPGTCAQLGAQCGRLPDGCGGIAECGACADGLHCGGDGPNRCGTNLCRPRTCAQVGASCGLVSDQCADVLDCGGCPAPQVCGAATPNQCGCNPRTCSQMNTNCGMAPDGCGNAIACGECPQGQTCGGAGPNRCGQGTCAARTCAQAGASCGMASDGCADMLDCGLCTAPGVCGGTGKANECGCMNKTCAQLGASCGSVAAGCGTDIQCGACPADDTCGGGGEPNQCGCPCELPHATTSCAGAPCHIQYCDDGWGDCDGSQATGCETDLMGDTGCPKPCKAEAECPQSYSCISGVCAPWPVGLIVPWGGDTLPAGWLEADGSAVSRTEWSKLFAAIGTTYGGGDGSTTFNLPDLRGRFALGQTGSATGSTLGERFGAMDHQHNASLAPHTHTVSMPAHSHAMSELPKHTHHWYFSADVTDNPGPNQVFLMSQNGDTDPATGGPFTTSAEGAGNRVTSSETSAAIMQPANPPYLVMRSLILGRTGAEAPCGAVWFEGKESPPPGAQTANGVQVSRAGNSWLFGCLKSAFGAGDGTSTFNLPDLRGRSALGRAVGGTGSTLGESGGSLQHTHLTKIDAVAHSIGIPEHSHTAAEPSHVHGVHPPPPEATVANGYMYGCITGLFPETDPAVGATATSSLAPAGTATANAAGGDTVVSSAGDAPFLAVSPVLFGTASHRLPSGTISAFAGTKVPFGWLVADGSAVSRTTYAALFAAIGTTFGAGDGSTSFNLPDLRGRSALGKADSGPGSQLASSGGSLDHVHDLLIPHHVHSVSFPSHTHNFHFPQHTHVLQHYQVLATSQGTTTQTARGVGPVVVGSGETDAVSQPASAAGANASPAGGETAATQSSNPPYVVVRYIIHR